MLITAPAAAPSALGAKLLRVMVVDDSSLYRKILARVVARSGLGEIAAEAGGGEEALALLDGGLAVDVMLLDVQMGGIDGFEVLKRMQARGHTVPVILVSAVSERAADIAVRAVAQGAFDFVAKPRGPSAEADLKQHVVSLLQALQARSAGRNEPRMQVRSQLPARPALASVPQVRPGVFTVLAIGSSTGGPGALMNVIPALPADFPIPVLIVQHMPPGFTASLAQQLDRVSRLRVVEATDGARIEAGTVLLAPGGRHMKVADRGRVVSLVDSPPLHGVRPSVDILFRSLSSSGGGPALSVILTGMGRDGCDGVAAVRRARGYCLAQDEASCVVYGMPRAVAEAGQADDVVTLDNMAAKIIALARRGGQRP